MRSPIQDVINSVGNAIINSSADTVRAPPHFGQPDKFTFGEYTNPVTGEIVRGDLTRFFAGDPTAGTFMTGFFPIMMFGLPAGAVNVRLSRGGNFGRGRIFAGICYFLFSRAIVKLNLPALGRVDETSAGEHDVKEIVEGLGGFENLVDVGNCATRLRVTIKDTFKVDEKILKSAGAKGVFAKGNAIPVVVGTNVEFVADAINSARKT